MYRKKRGTIKPVAILIAIFSACLILDFLFFVYDTNNKNKETISEISRITDNMIGFAPIFPDICYHLTHYKPAAADIPVASDNPAHYADAIRYNARTPLQGSLLPLTRLVWA